MSGVQIYRPAPLWRHVPSLNAAPGKCGLHPGCLGKRKF